jgi:hypothetical protein
MRVFVLILAFTASSAFCTPQLAPNAPKDKPASATKDQVPRFERAIAPYVAKAKATYPDAKNRFLAGLPPKQVFFITTRLHDKDGKWEQAFIRVATIKHGKVTGTIASDLEMVKSFKNGQKYTFPEDDLLDWAISKPDGTEEGNFVGNCLDTYKP